MEPSSSLPEVDPIYFEAEGDPQAEQNLWKAVLLTIIDDAKKLESDYKWSLKQVPIVEADPERLNNYRRLLSSSAIDLYRLVLDPWTRLVCEWIEIPHSKLLTVVRDRLSAIPGVKER